MNEKRLAVWREIEESLGLCCLHKRAALNEVMGLPLNVLSLATIATEQEIETFLGGTKYEKSANRYTFNYKGVQFDLTSFADETDDRALHQKVFRHTLTIDSVGCDSNGEVSDLYYGVSDYKKKILRLTTPESLISEGLMKRILAYVTDGFSLDKGLKEKIDREKYFEKPTYRKKFAESLISTLANEKKAWGDVARLIELAANLQHKKAVVAFTEKTADDKSDPRVRRTFAFFVFAFMKATSKEIAPFMQGEKALDYYDSVCSNINKRVKTRAEFNELKQNYGEEFMQVLFDVQELWMRVENMPFRRPKESDFNLMAQLIANKKYWTGIREEEAASEDSKEEYEVNAENVNCADLLSEKYDEEAYRGDDDDMGGPVVDDYVPVEIKDASPISTVTTGSDYELPPKPKNGHYVDDDVFPDDDDKDGLDYGALDEIEKEVAEQMRSSPVTPPPAVKTAESIRTARDHKSNLLNDGVD